MNKKSFFFFFLVLLLSLNNSELFPSSSAAVHSENIFLQEPAVLPDPLMTLPFILLLIAIATGPVFYRHFWEHHYPKISISLGLVTIIYYIIFLKDLPSLSHSLAEFLSFIALLSSLFVASGGILIRINRKATPLFNSLFLLFGAVLSNFIGTTGASMLLIRPFIQINRDRISAYHIIFFIFIVSNIGGMLTPIGDPPLFLGFLRGVPFFWVIANVWHIWIPVTLFIVGIFYVMDSLNKGDEQGSTVNDGRFEFGGLKNLFYLGIILIAVFLDPAVIPWIPSLSPLPIGIREIIMFAVVYLSYQKADKEVLKRNEFDFEPIKEVAFLFAGIFATMIPALQLIAYEAKVFGDQLNAGTFFWATGLLSGFLDNAPTYLNFLSAAMGKFGLEIGLQEEVRRFVMEDTIYLRAISVAAVYFGAMTYIGNGPNFMVKSISERAGIGMPSFFSYLVKFSIPILIPPAILIWLIFFN